MEGAFSEVCCGAYVLGNDTSPSLTQALPALNDQVIIQGYASFGTSKGKAMDLEEQVLTGMVLYWWVVFVLWATRRGWE